MQSRTWVLLRRGGVTSSLVALFLLCLPGIAPVGSSVAQAEAQVTASAPLALGSGYGRSEGSARVRVLQQRLRKLEQQPGPVDGLYGPLTEAAVRRFQSSAGLQVDGIVGPRTLKALRSEWPQPVGRGEGFGRRGGSDQVRAVQRRLRTADQQPGPVDGVFGPRTEAAVIGFQSKTGLAADGVVGQNTWRALERARSRFAARRAEKNVALRRAATKLRQQTADGRSATLLSKLPAASTDEQGVDPLLLLGLIAAMTFVVAAFGHALVRRRVPVAEGSHREVRPVPVHAATNQARRRQKSEPGGRDDDTVRAVGYVSGVGSPALAGPDVRKQIATIGAACDQRGWELTEIVRDLTAQDGQATTPGLAYAVERLAVDEPSCLVVAELRRLSGSPGELGRIIQSLRERDVRLVAVNTELDTSTAEGRLAADALISVGEREHEREAQTQGEIPMAAAKGSPVSRPAVRDLPALRKHIVAMRSSGMTLQAIADRLNAEGVPTLRGGKMWRPSSVQSAVGYRRPGQPGRAGSLPTGRLGGG